MPSFKDRHDDYESKYDMVIMKKLPIIIRAELHNYRKLTESLAKPYSQEFTDIMAQSMLYCISDIPDAVFGFCHNKEISIILKNNKEHDYEPWYKNNVQKIISSVASSLTISFYKYKSLCHSSLNIAVDPVFTCKAFAVPYVYEAANNLVLRQQLGFRFAINEALIYELSKKYNKIIISDMLKNKSDEEKISILLHNCGIDFYNYYPPFYINGIAVYKIPTIVQTRNGGISRNKWQLNDNIVSFVNDKDFLSSIINNGTDVYRASEILEKF
jgi:tRNA(His) 5'-end guanylyltransferase